MVLVLSGCDGCSPEDLVPVRVDAISDVPAGLWIGQGSGVGSAQVPILTVNDVGASVPGPELALTSSGTLSATTAAPDAFGWAIAELTASSPGHFDVGASAGTFQASGSAFVTARPDAARGFPAWLSGGVGSPVGHGGGGMVTTRGGELWWWSFDGGAPVRVLELSSAVKAVRAARLDDDGVDDILVYSDDEVVLLRGRPSGGLAFAAGWRPAIGSLRAVVVRAADEDALVDVILVVGDADSASVVWMPGDGQGGWAPTSVLDVDVGVHGASVEDLDGDGVAEVSLLTGDGVTRRYEWREEGWLAANTMDANVGIAAGADVRGGFDVDGDRRDDVLISGPLADDSGGYSAVMLMPDDTIGAVFQISSSIEPVEGLAATVVDADGDGSVEVLMSTPDQFARAHWSAAVGTYVLEITAGLPYAPVIDAPDFSGDSVPDLALSREAAIGHRAERVVDDPETEADETAWGIARAYDGVFDINLFGEPWMGDLNDDGIIDLVALVDNGGAQVQALVGSPVAGANTEDLNAGPALSFLPGEDPVDLAVCGRDVWLLVDGALATLVRHLDVDAAGRLTSAGPDVVASGTMLACGDFAAGRAVVVDAAGDRLWLPGDGSSVPEAGTGPLGDIVAADTDGDGVEDLVGCEGVCTIAAGDFDADGTADLVWSDGVDTTVRIGGADTALGFGGAVSAGDADGDGVTDIVVQLEGVLVSWRGLAGAVGVPVLGYMARAARGRGYVGDLSGDGVPDGFWLGDEGAIWYAAGLAADAP
ncbi:MAG: VCBS repeat-containing protein [Myxococcales bacterium]|nr:VCBS repeat-containing protein [Myxococcales bacterium]